MAILPLYAGERGDIDGRGRGSLLKTMRRRLLEARHGVLGSSMGLVAFGSVLIFMILVIVLTVSFVSDHGESAPHMDGAATAAAVPEAPVLDAVPRADQDRRALFPHDGTANRATGSGGKGPTQQHHGMTPVAEAEPEAPGSNEEGDPRAARVVAAFRHAWQGYARHAFGHDEVRPTTNATNDSWGGFGAVLVDGLDTMMLMGLTEEVARCRAHIATLDFKRDYSASFFETTIRYLGGLLSAYDLSGDKLYLTKATELGERLLPAFNSPSGLPYHEVNLLTGGVRNPSWSSANAILAEAGSFQLEFTRLSELTGDSRFADKVAAVNTIISRIQPPHGLFAVQLSMASGAPSGTHFSTGALADSFYEYLLKQHLLSGGRDAAMLSVYQRAAGGITSRLLAFSEPGRLPFIAQEEGGDLVPVFDHLSCFVPGMFALSTLAAVQDKDATILLASSLSDTCVRLYTDQPTGLGPEIVRFNTHVGGGGGHDYSVQSASYVLRPETLESLFVLYRMTGDPRYQNQAWAIFLAIERHCKTAAAYSGLRDVTRLDGELNNSMQSFFMAETLKYLFLIFSPPTLVPLDQWVLTTEAHPLRISSRVA